MPDVQAGVRDRIATAIHDFLPLVRGERSGANLADLARALDGLVACYHDTFDVEPDTDAVSAAPRIEEKPIIDAIGTAFPELGWYALADPQDEPDARVGLSIAAGDLAEIAADLVEILWLFDNASENDAIWQFRWGYQYHWGRHLHEIRVYLHSLSAW